MTSNTCSTLAIIEMPAIIHYRSSYSAFYLPWLCFNDGALWRREHMSVCFRGIYWNCSKLLCMRSRLVIDEWCFSVQFGKTQWLIEKELWESFLSCRNRGVLPLSCLPAAQRVDNSGRRSPYYPNWSNSGLFIYCSQHTEGSFICLSNSPSSSVGLSKELLLIIYTHYHSTPVYSPGSYKCIQRLLLLRDLHNKLENTSKFCVIVFSGYSVLCSLEILNLDILFIPVSVLFSDIIFFLPSKK